MEAEGATERLIGATMEGESNMDQKPLKKFTMTDNAAAAAPNNGSFDCNICLDLAADPIVTLCGHLYCWPCIYRWLQQGDGASPQQCPVCKAALLHQSLVPLYGHGQSRKAATSQQILDVPRRPAFDQREAIEQGLLELNEDQNRAAQPLHLAEHHVLDHPFDSSVGDDFRGTRMMHPTSGEVLGGIAVAVLPWVFRNQESGRVHHSSPSHLVGSGGGSSRQEMELRRSLHQIWLFLFCCAILCLLLF